MTGFASKSQAGHERRFYYNKATHAAPTWTEIVNARNVRINVNRGEADVSRRAGRGNAMTRPGQRTTELTFEYVHSTNTDAIWTDLLASESAGTPFEFWDADRAAGAGAKGWRGVFYVASIEEAAEEDGATVYTVTCRLTDAEEGGVLLTPDWYQAGA
jgi:hypothetical protein